MKEQIEELAGILTFLTRISKDEAEITAGTLYQIGYRKQSKVIDEFVRRLLDAFPEGNRDAKCPAIYYDDYRYIIEELAEELKGGAE